MSDKCTNEEFLKILSTESTLLEFWASPNTLSGCVQAGYEEVEYYVNKWEELAILKLAEINIITGLEKKT